jgi:Proton-conducting membrane transporter
VTAVGATALAAAGSLWLAAAMLGPLAARRVGLRAVAVVSALGGLAAGIGGVTVAVAGVRDQWTLGAGNLVGSLTLRLEPLAGVFLVLLGLVAVAIAWFGPHYHSPGAGTAAYLCALQLALLASLAVLVAGNGVVFLVAWESMTVLSYLLILRYHQREGVARAAFWFVAIGEAGFALLVAAFTILDWKTGTLDLGGIATLAGQIPDGWRSLVFVLALVGFGAKAGLVPLHVWLPMAHPAAPADGSAFLSGLVIKLGVFGIALFGFDLLGPGHALVGAAHHGAGCAVRRARHPLRADGTRPQTLPGLLQHRARRHHRHRHRRLTHLRRLRTAGALCLPAAGGAVPRGQPRRLQDPAVPGGRRGRARHRHPQHGPAGRPGQAAARLLPAGLRRHARPGRAATAQRLRQRMAGLPGAVPGVPDPQPPGRHPDRRRRGEPGPHRRPGDQRLRAGVRHPLPGHGPHRRRRHRDRARPAAGRPGAAGHRRGRARHRRAGRAWRPRPGGARHHRRGAASHAADRQPHGHPRAPTSPPSPPPTWRCAWSPCSPCR